jgi:ABC-type transport system substrate-binding protein
VLEAHDKHWNGSAKIKRVTIEIVQDSSARVAAINGGGSISP